jgi:glycosyltransferase involved in cell wall biosynthesis
MIDVANIIDADIILTHRDIWVDDPENSKNFPTASWFPIDHEPVGEHLMERFKTTRWLATMSRRGVDLIANAGYKAHYIPHSVDGSVYKYRRSPELRKKLFGNAIPDDAYLIFIVAANKGFPSRKGYPEMFEAVARFMQFRPDAYLYVHALITEEEGGPNLLKLAKAVGIDENRFQHLNPVAYHWGLDEEEMAEFYQAADVLLNCSYGEGFGIPILEAQACGTPVITTDFSSMPEITWYGYTVGGRRMMTAHYAYWLQPDIQEIVSRLEEVYMQRGSEAFLQHGKRVADMIAKEWTDDAVFHRYWRPFLGSIQADLALLRGKQMVFAG